MNSVLQETRSARTTRRALNDLQYSPNGKTIAGIQMSPRKYIEADPLKPGRILFDNNLNTSQFNRPLKKRTSISLPDICSTAKSLSVSQVSTPSKSKTTSTQNTPFKSGRKDISIILEEKENPNSTFHLDKNSICYGSHKNLTKLRETIKEEKAESKECSIQCNKSDEDMLLSDNVDSTPYWRLLTYKRFKCLQETLKENHELNQEIAKIDNENDELRKQNEELMVLIAEYNEIKNSITELIDMEDDDHDDSGLERSQLN